MKGILTAITLALGAIVALPAQAQTFNGQTRGVVALRAGPDIGYPQVAMLPAGTNVTIYGCVDDWSWCDVQWRHERGWVSAGMLNTRYSGRYYTVGISGYDLGIPILSFIIHDYWSHHYRARPWYRQAPRWYSYRPNRPNRHIRPPVYGPRPPAYRPPVHGPRPPHHGHRPGQGRPDWGRDRNHDRDREWNRGGNHNRNRDWNGDRNRNEVRRPDVQRPLLPPSDPRGHRAENRPNPPARGPNVSTPDVRRPDVQRPPNQRQIQQIRRERVEQRIQRQQEK